MVRRRPAIILGALLAVAFAAQPAAAFVPIYTDGTYYEPQVTDEFAAPGVTCVYEDNTGTKNDELDRIKVKQFFTHAPYADKTYVGFRLQITRRAPDSSTFKPYQSRPIVKKLANLGEVAFFKGTWVAPEGLKSGEFRAVIKLYFYEEGSSTKVGGELRGRLEAYKRKLNADIYYVDGDAGDPGSCAARYPAP